MKKEITKKRIITAGAVTLIVMLLAWVGLYLMRGRKATNTVVLDQGWTVRINDKVTENADLAVFYFRNLKRLDSIEISRVITEDLKEGYTAKVKAQFCSVEAFVDDEPIYSFGTREVAENSFLGSGYVFIPLPEDITGKTLRIRFIVNEKNYMTDIGSIRLEKTVDATRLYANANATSVYLNGFVMVFGIALILLGVFVKAFGQDYLTLVLIGVFSALVGHWAGCQGKIYEIFSDGITKISTQEFICLYSAPIPLAIYIWRRHINEKGWREVTLRICTAVFTLFDIITCLLHVTNICRFPQTLVSFHILGTLSLIVILWAGVLHMRKDRPSDMIVILAFLQVTIASFLDLVRLNLQKLVWPNNDIMAEVSFLPIGAILFMTMLVASYLASLYETVLSHAERDALTKIAYHDPLTGLYNRAKANERFEELDAQDTAVALVNFDVNGLKYVNDNFGHEEGDNLLKGISEAIEKAFGNIGTGFRMGGDEFLCIVDPAGIFTIKQAADKMEQELREKSRNSRFTYSVSYGIAYRNKGENRSIQELFAEADEKMYAMKEKSKYSRKALEGKA